jgi:RNA polymerase sigma-70 factor (ECF subfamily)
VLGFDADGDSAEIGLGTPHDDCAERNARPATQAPIVGVGLAACTRGESAVSDERGEVTLLLEQLREGQPQAESHLFTLAYDRLRRIAGSHVRRAGNLVTLNPTALVSEAYVKFRPAALRDVETSAHFYRIMSRAMRQVVIDLVRRRTSLNAAQVRSVTLDEQLPEAGMPLEELLTLDEALTGLESLDQELAQLVEWRFYGGLDVDEIAALMGVTGRTVRRKWQVAKMILSQYLAE